MRIFLLGAIGYPALELLYRRRTHYSMALAGGAAALLIDRIRKLPGGMVYKAALCGAGVTAIEFLCGMIWNRDYAVWDYRRVPLNWQGQICLRYTMLWCGLSAGVMAALNMLEKRKGSDR